MNCREFIIEFEERGTLSEPATLHLTICADCKQMSERQAQIWLMIDDLKPVAAPSDFDFHVKAKIANAKPSDFRSPRFMPILRYILPLSIAVLLLGLFVFRAAYFSDAPTNSQLAQSRVETPEGNAILPTALSPSNRLTFVPSNENTILAVSSANEEKSNAVPKVPIIRKHIEILQSKREIAGLMTNKGAKSPNSRLEDDSGAGSLDGALTSAPPPLMPRGINLNSNTANAPRSEETLSIIGIKFVSENGKRTVEAVQENSIADKSGVKVGDVIETFKGSVLNVLRGTQKLEITLRDDFNQKP